MEKPIFTIEQVLSMDLPPVIIYAAPVMFILVLIEWYIRTKELKEHYDEKDGFSALIIGLGNVGLSAVIKVVLFGIILFFYNLVPWYIPHTWWSYILCIIAIDFFSLLVAPDLARAALLVGNTRYTPQFRTVQFYGRLPSFLDAAYQDYILYSGGFNGLPPGGILHREPDRSIVPVLAAHRVGT